MRAATDSRPLVREFDPELVVNDILTLAPALAAELEGRRRVTVVPHFYPPTGDGLPQYGLGAMPPTTPAGRRFWRAMSGPTGVGVERGRRELNETRRRLGLAPISHSYGGMSRELTLVATFPQLEYPRTLARARARQRAAAVGAAGRRGRAAAGRGAAGAGRAEHLAGPRAAAAVRRAEGARRSSGARARHLQPASAAAADRRPGQRAAGRLGLRTRRRCRSPTW